MILFFIILGLIIAIIVLAIRYFMAYAKLTSHKSYDREASKAAKSFVYEDSNITCDYCGGKINVAKDSICPLCGASFDQDEEWKNRFKVNQPKVDDAAEKKAAREISAAQKQAKAIAKSLRRLIFILLGILAAFTILAVIMYFTSCDDDFAKSEKVNTSSYENYQKVDYSFTNERVVEANGLTVDATGIYYDEKFDDYKIEFHIKNNSEENLRLRFKIYSVNHISDGGHRTFIYEKIKKGSDIVIYEKLYMKDVKQVESVDFGYFDIYGDDYRKEYENDDIVTLKTTKDSNTLPEAPNEEILFENDKIVVYSIEPEEGIYEDDYEIALYNKLDDPLNLKVIIRLNKKELDLHFDDDEKVAGHTLFYSGSIYGYSDEYKTRKPGDLLQMSISISYQEYPENDFSTGYFEIK